jgi:hypothetical protein
LAYLALASGVMITLSGCFSTCDSGSMFPRLSSRYGLSGETGDCGCAHASHGAPVFDVPPGQGPFIGPPPAPVPGPIPIGAQPPLPPIVTKTPQAAPVPYFP